MNGPETQQARRALRLSLVAVGAALLLRLAEVFARSLWMDEFHTLFHARFDGLGPWLEFLRRDNHPPLSFLAVRVSTGLFGTSPLALRAPAVLFGIWCVVQTARLARDLTGTRAPSLAAWLVALSTLHMTATTEARMYALVAVAVTGTLLALRDTLSGRPAPWRLGAWLWVGLHAHYFFLHYAAVIALAASGLLIASRELRPRLLRLAPGVAAAVALAAPWYLYGFREQLLGHSLHPGARMDPLRTLPEAVAHLLFHNVSLGGAARPVLLGAALFAPLLALWGGARLVLRRTPRRPLAVLLAAAAFGVPLWAALVSLVFPRSGFNWTYFTGCVAPFALLVASVPRPSRLSAAATGFVLTAAAWLAVCNAASPGTEDYRGAVRHLLETAHAEDAVLVIEPGFEVFPNALGWEYYAPRLAAPDAPPQRIPLTETYELPDPAVLADHPRAFLMQRGLDDVHPTLRTLREHYPTEHQDRFGYSLFLHRFE